MAARVSPARPTGDPERSIADTTDPPGSAGRIFRQAICVLRLRVAMPPGRSSEAMARPSPPISTLKDRSSSAEVAPASRMLGGGPASPDCPSVVPRPSRRRRRREPGTMRPPGFRQEPGGRGERHPHQVSTAAWRSQCRTAGAAVATANPLSTLDLSAVPAPAWNRGRAYRRRLLSEDWLLSKALP